MAGDSYINRRILIWITTAFLIVISAAFFLFLSPLLILLIPIGIFGYFEHRSFIKKYNDYLRTIEGTKFFCYSSRTNSRSYTKTKILPLLDPDIKIIYLEGKTPRSHYNQKFISHALHSLKDRKGFPYLLKICDGKVIDKSINKDFYTTMNQNKDLAPLIEKINLFFQTK